MRAWGGGLVVLLAWTAAAAGGSWGRIEVGQPLPALVLPDLHGAPASPAQFRGRKVLLQVFASW